MNPSKLNKRITIQKEITNKKDEEGNPIPPEWKDVVTVWARAKHHLERDLTMKYSLEILKMRYVQ